MAVTKSWDNSLALELELAQKSKLIERRRELFWLIAASLFVACGLALVFVEEDAGFRRLAKTFG